MNEPIKKAMIFIVEDDPASQQLFQFFLKNKYNTCKAVSVKDAKEILEKRDIGLILLDLSLVGNEDGLDLVRYIRSSDQWKDLPIIAITAHAYISDERKCLKAGCNDYMAKPIKQEDFLERIKKYI